jgi:Phage integrase family
VVCNSSAQGVYFPDALTHRVPKVPKGCFEGFWHLLTLGFARRAPPRQLEERMKASSWEDPGLVFPNTKGKIRRRDSAVRSFKRYLEGAGIPTDVRFHDLRHTAGTLALRQGMPLHAVSKMLGHSDPAMTLSATLTSSRTWRMRAAGRWTNFSRARVSSPANRTSLGPLRLSFCIFMQHHNM